MRLIGDVASEDDAVSAIAILEAEGIAAGFDKIEDKIQIWVEDEDELGKAQEILDTYKSAPQKKRFIKAKAKRVVSEKKSTFNPILTKIIAGVCIFFFFWTWLQEIGIMKKDSAVFNIVELTPLAATMLYDYPKTFELMRSFIAQYPIRSEKDLKTLPEEGKQLFRQIERTPYWQGIYQWVLTGQGLKAPLFEKIKEGQFWRLISPVFLHGNILHILFNLLWLWLLGRMVEERIRPLSYLLLMLVIGIVSNTAQYLMSGPFFIGYSGIITGLAGFIFVRQKKAPWEGYPLPRSTLIFLLIFIFGMALLGVVDFFLQKFQIHFFPMRLANTAHIVGLFVGALCAFIPYFYKRRKA